MKYHQAKLDENIDSTNIGKFEVVCFWMGFEMGICMMTTVLLYWQKKWTQ